MKQKGEPKKSGKTDALREAREQAAREREEREKAAPPPPKKGSKK
jgi:hypothetical protein